MSDTPRSRRKVGVVMAGGSGERFWPLSTPTTPKQLLNLTHPDKNMLEEAVERLHGIVDETFVSTTVPLSDPIKASGVVPGNRVLAEPARRNTLGALSWTVAELLAQGFDDAVVAVVTADHFIGEVPRFRSAISYALDFALTVDSFVTFGIRPDRPETGYGYIEIEEKFQAEKGGDWQAFRSVAFREKPKLETAIEYHESGLHLWNSGMFFFSVEAFVNELGRVQPEAAAHLTTIVECLQNEDRSGAKEAFEKMPNQAIDIAVMEKVPHVYLIPVDFPWDDVGAWDALERTGESMEGGNAIRGNPILVDVTDSIVVQSEESIDVTVLGLSDVVVVVTGKSVLVCHKSQAQRVRELARLVAERRSAE